MKYEVAYFKTKAVFDLKLAAGEVKTNWLCFIQDKLKLWTHGTYYDGAVTLGDAIPLNTYSTVTGNIAASDTVSKAIGKLLNLINTLNTTVSNNKTAIETTVTNNYNTLDNKIDETKEAIDLSIGNITNGSTTVGNSDKLDGKHLSELFTLFAASGDNTLITVGGTLKTLDIPHAKTASTLKNSRKITLSGAVTGNSSFNGGSDITITTTDPFHSGHNTITAINAVPVNKKLVICTLNANGTLGLSGTLKDGYEVHLIIKNSSSNTITVTIPSSMKNLLGDNLEIEPTSRGTGYGELNVISDGTNLYVRGISN